MICLEHQTSNYQKKLISSKMDNANLQIPHNILPKFLQNRYSLFLHLKAKTQISLKIKHSYRQLPVTVLDDGEIS